MEVNSKPDNKNDKNKADLITGMMSEEIKTARAAISKIRRSGKIQDIPRIIEALRLQANETIQKEIHSLLCDIKVPGSSDLIMAGIKDPVNNEILARLLSVCWESKQDFSGHLEVFISMFLNSDYAASIEAFTVIEKIYMNHDIPQEKLQTTIQVIKTSYPDLSQNKRDLALVLLETLENLSDT